ncbi:DUF397 domain-containing protein [Streptomyces sp. NBC_01716]|uniref:DUF397 domain-containing protein n=1 Tax=Streptomyces sp. NBC_01716 TaxID=2975917 RepID=UPI002E31E69B|nr:DUF397 domain-containing protein [Streptomyces sp. NBC_01716]
MNSKIKWQKSSFSGSGAQCVEVAEHNGAILLRESDEPNAITTTNRDKFAAFIAGIKAGEFDHFAN